MSAVIVCTLPLVTSGSYLGVAWANHQNNSRLDDTKITCNNGYHRTVYTAFNCSCGGAGQACASITNACEPHTCTLPVVAYGSHSVVGWADRNAGAALNPAQITCNAGYHRSSSASFACTCTVNGQACATISNACDEDGGTRDATILHLKFAGFSSWGIFCPPYL